MSEELEDLRRALQEERRRREEEQRRREDAELRQKEEQRRREVAEQRTRPTTLPDFLQRCHDLCTSINVVLDKSLTTQGEITTPTNRLYPKKILPWTGFTERQAEIWEEIGKASAFPKDHLFSSPSDFEYVHKQLRPIASEQGLRRFESLTVESMVSELIERTGENITLSRNLGLDREMVFQDHTNLGDEGNAELYRAMQDLRLQQNAKRAVRQQSPHRHRGTADQFCVLKSDENGSTRPTVAIEYKAPHKLTSHTIALGLKTEINTYRDVISQTQAVDALDEQESEAYWCKYVMAAVVTQLFSYMVTQGTRYGYICTGQAYVFLRIGDDASNVYYSVHVPIRDFDREDPWRLHRTAVARVFAFIVQAAPEAGPEQDWHQRRALLSPWQVDARDIIYQMPDSIRTNASDIEYVPDEFVEWNRSPIRTRTGCRPNESRRVQRGEGSGSDAEGGQDPESPSQQRRTRFLARAKEMSSGGSRSGLDTSAGKRGSRRHKSAYQNTTDRPIIADRPYCSQTCLYGLAHGGVTDRYCPNFRFHGTKHPAKSYFLRLVRQQLQLDTGKNADCVPLYIHGARGGLLKICLTSHGYTFVAKGAEQHNLEHLHHEHGIYRQLLPLQGNHVPVCLGLMELRQVYYYSGAQLSHLLLMSWGGRPLPAPANMEYRASFPKLAEEALAAVHLLKVLHRDAEPRNMLFDASRMKLMVIDFERSESCARQALSLITANGVQLRAGCDKLARCGSAFDREMRATLNCLIRYLG